MSDTSTPADQTPTLKVVQPKAAKVKPRHPLPTERIAVKKQIDLLRAYAIAYEQHHRPITYNEVISILKLNPVTASLATPFFVDAGLLEKSAQQGFIPTPVVMAYYHAYKWNPEGAPDKLAPAFSDTWFARNLMPKLRFKNTMTLDSVITTLAEESNAQPEHRGQLRALIDLMAEVGMITRDGNQIRLGNALPVAEPEATTPPPSTDREPAPRPASTAPVATTLQGGLGGVRFSVNVAVDMEEFRTWSPDRISAFFNGIAAVLAAKAAVERDAAKGAS
jgi:hypothetical protein